MRGNGGGVAALMKGHILGGDSGFIYAGTYQSDGKTLSARVSVKNFLPDVPSVLGIVGDVELVLNGQVSGDVIKATASLANGEDIAGLVAKLTKANNLPAAWR